MPDTAMHDFVKEVWGLQGVAYCIVFLRYYARISLRGWQKLDWDDGLIILATLCYTAESVAAYYVVVYWRCLANNAMTDGQRASLDPSSEEWRLRVNGSKTHVIGLIMYTTLLWLLKGCWVVYYARLTASVHDMKRLIAWAVIMMPLTYVACLLVAFLKCIPFEKHWQINPSPGNHCMPSISSFQTLFVMVMNTLTDSYLMAIPIPMIWKSNLHWRKKITLMIVFSGGLIEMTFGILRCISILTVGDHDPAESVYWSVRESFVSFALTNLPMIYPLFHTFFDKIGSTLVGSGRRSSGNKPNNNNNSQSYRLGSVPAQQRSRLKSREPVPTPHDMLYGSDEHIFAVAAESSNSGSGRRRGTGSAVSTAEDDGLCIPAAAETNAFPLGMSTVQVVADPSSEHVRVLSASVPRSGITVTKEYTVMGESLNRYCENGGGGGY